MAAHRQRAVNGISLPAKLRLGGREGEGNRDVIAIIIPQ